MPSQNKPTIEGWLKRALGVGGVFKCVGPNVYSCNMSLTAPPHAKSNAPVPGPARGGEPAILCDYQFQFLESETPSALTSKCPNLSVKKKRPSHSSWQQQSKPGLFRVIKSSVSSKDVVKNLILPFLPCQMSLSRATVSPILCLELSIRTLNSILLET